MSHFCTILTADARIVRLPVRPIRVDDLRAVTPLKRFLVRPIIESNPEVVPGLPQPLHLVGHELLFLCGVDAGKVAAIAQAVCAGVHPVLLGRHFNFVAKFTEAYPASEAVCVDGNREWAGKTTDKQAIR